MINFENEKDLAIDTQTAYEIMDFAMQSAEDDGFINSFVFQRAIYLYAAITLYQDRKEEIAELINVSPLIAWTALINDGTIAKMNEEYPKEMEFLAENGEIWFDEFTKYAHSARGLIDVLKDFSDIISKNAADQLNELNNGPELKQILDIANNWGMNRAEDAAIIDGESLFE